MQEYSKVSEFVLINRIIQRLETAHHMRKSAVRVLGGRFSSALIQLGGSE